MKQTQSPLLVCAIYPDLTPSCRCFSSPWLNRSTLPSHPSSSSPTLQGPLSILCVQPGMNLQPGNAPGVSDRLPRREGVILTARGSNRVIYYTVQLLPRLTPRPPSPQPTPPQSYSSSLPPPLPLRQHLFGEDECGAAVRIVPVGLLQIRALSRLKRPRGREFNRAAAPS